MKIFLPMPGQNRYSDALAALGAQVETDAPEGCAALLLPGGGDLHPSLYGQEDRGSTNIDEQRDRAELALMRRFTGLQLPVLGVCRGCQLVNVFFGGTLHQDIPGHSRLGQADRMHGSYTDDPVLNALYGTRFPVNSSHHQAVDRLGSGLHVIQWADDGTVEAIRHETLPVFCVQWHPERLRTPTDGWRLLEWWLGTVRAQDGACRG